MHRVPQVLENATFPSRKPVEEMGKMKTEIGRVEKLLGDRGRVLVRWSGTEPKLRVMIEGEDQSAITAHAHEILEAAKKDMAAS
jgi:phosphoglucosamine mutase